MKREKAIGELIRYLIMIATFAFMSSGMLAMVNAGVGTPPWDVLHLGLSLRLALSYGRIIQITGLLLVLISWLLGVKPHLGTLLNIIFIGLFVDLFSTTALIPQPDHLALRLLQLVCGTVIFAYGTAVYILINRGTGPRDSLMVALSRLTKLRMGLVRTFIEVAVTITGFLLGGPLGIGTMIFALTVGPLMEFFFTVANKQKKLVVSLLTKITKRSKELSSGGS